MPLVLPPLNTHKRPLLLPPLPTLLPASSGMRIVSSSSRSPPRLMTRDPSPFSSPTRPPLPRHLRHILTLFPPSSTSHFPWANLPGCPSASPLMWLSSPSTHSQLPSSQRTQRNSSRAWRSRSSTPRTYASSPPDTSTPTYSPGRARLPPLSLFPSTLETSLRWAPRFISSPARERLNTLTLPSGTRSARTAGDTAMSPRDAPPPIPFAPSAPSATLEPCTDAPIPPALEVGTLRLLLAVVLPRPSGAPITQVSTLRLTGIVTPDRLRPLSGVQPLPTRSFLRRPLATK